jgi:hypothetical protein
MNTNVRRATILVIVLALLLAFGVAGYAADIPKLKMPLLITSLGQAPDANTVATLAKRSKVPAKFITLAKAADVAKFKTMIVTVGTSLKGFGAAGVNLDTETARARELAKAAKNKGVYVILAHIGGEGRRDSMTNLLLNEFAPQADAFIVYQEGNKDGFFTEAAGKKPLVLLPKAIEMGNMLKQLTE